MANTTSVLATVAGEEGRAGTALSPGGKERKPQDVRASSRGP